MTLNKLYVDKCSQKTFCNVRLYANVAAFKLELDQIVQNVIKMAAKLKLLQVCFTKEITRD